MRIFTGFGFRLRRFDFLLQLDTPKEDGYDFHLIDINLHECDGDIAINFILMSIRLRLGWVKKEAWEEMKQFVKAKKDQQNDLL